MCVVAIAWNAHPRWRLVVAGNRDELHSRASAPLANWNDQSGIIAGRDLVSGGSWMGVSQEGRFAVVTNIRDADGPDPDKASRGFLVGDWLKSGELPTAGRTFNPFNLIVTDHRSARFISNRPEPTEFTLAPGVHGLSNAIPAEHWPRKERLVAQMSDWLAGLGAHPEVLLDLLAEELPPDRDAYPLFIQNPIYGTRCSTVVAVDQAGYGRITERSFDADGAASGERSLCFDWSK